MGKGKSAEKNAPQAQAGGAENKFESAFKPQKSGVKFGALKHEKLGAEKKRKKKFPPKGLVVFLLVLVLLGGAGAGLYFTGLLTPILELAGLVQSTAQDQPTLEEREAMLVIREAALNDREKALLKREEQLAARQAELAAQEALSEADQTFREMLQGFSDEEVEDLKRMGVIYAKMGPGEAAAILKNMYDLKKISAVIYHMQPAAAALILEQMEAGTAAKITDIILS